MTRRIAALFTVLACVMAGPVAAVGLGPLSLDGVTASERKGFFLTLINPYPTAQRFRLQPTGFADESVPNGIILPVAEAIVAPGGQRRLLVIAADLRPGERRAFRVCAARVEPPSSKELIHARVCAKLVARRLG